MMGKYMRKAKLSGEVAVMEVAAHQSSLGVRTRARTLAAAAAAQDSSSLAYLELRSRRLEKPPLPVPASKTRSNVGQFSSQKAAAARAPTANSAPARPLRTRRCSEKHEHASTDAAVSENTLEIESGERETTPCGLMRDYETIGAPGSMCSIDGNQRLPDRLRQDIPTTQELEEFFVGLEKLQQQIFIEKYNFDPVNDHPLPGRFEWVELDS